jgi:hypothetical protein
MALINKDIERLKLAIKDAGFNLETKESLQDFINLMSKLGKIKNRYKGDTIKYLASFEDSNHLEKYISSAYKINEYSNDNSVSHFKINHILFKIIKQNYISLYTLLSYQFSSFTIDDLDDAYTLSGKIQKKLIKTMQKGNSRSERLAWFINLKNPLVYWDSVGVKKHYSMIIENLSTKENIDNKRMHIFYEEYFNSRALNLKQIRKMFQGLFFEKLIGIDNKLIIIKNFDEIKHKLYFDPYSLKEENSEIYNSEQFKCLFLLDYALYQFPNIIRGESCQDNDYYLLPANFSLEPPILEEKNILYLKKKYEKEAVFEFTGPYIYYIFKRNFQSFWHKDNYISSLDDLIIHKAWRISKSYKSEILKILFEDSSFISNIKLNLDCLNNKISLYIEDFTIDLESEYESFARNNIIQLCTFVKNNLSSNELVEIEAIIEDSPIFNNKGIDLKFKTQLSNTIFDFNQSINLILRKLVTKKKTTIAGIKDYLNELFLMSEEHFSLNSQEFHEEERALLELVFSCYNNDLNELIFSKRLADDFNELEREIFSIRDIFDKNIQVVDFFTFWDMIIKDSRIPINNVEDLFDDLFLDSNEEKESIYKKTIEKMNDTVYNDLDLLRKKIIQLCNEFYENRIVKTKNKKLLQEKFEIKFSEFLIHKK